MEQQEERSEEVLNDELMEILLNTREQGQMVEQLIKNQIEVKDELINKLHKELEYYKQESAEKIIVQVMKSIIKVRKDAQRIIHSKEWETMSVDDLKREYVYLWEDITDLLEQQNIDAYSTEVGEAFDASIHQPKLVQTSEPTLDKTIKESLAEGYMKGSKVIQPEKVVVYQYKE